MNKSETTAREWYAEGLRIGTESSEQRIVSLLMAEAARTSVGTFNAHGVLMSLIDAIKNKETK